MTDKQVAATVLNRELLWSDPPQRHQFELVYGAAMTDEQYARVKDQFHLLVERVRRMLGRDYYDGR